MSACKSTDDTNQGQIERGAPLDRERHLAGAKVWYYEVLEVRAHASDEVVFKDSFFNFSNFVNITVPEGEYLVKTKCHLDTKNAVNPEAYLRVEEHKVSVIYGTRIRFKFSFPERNFCQLEQI